MTGVPLAQQVGERLRAKKLTLVTAESCTGGLIASLLTDVPGSSDYYLGGAVTYSNALKENLVGVSRDSLIEHGAVSEPVARQMAAGARERFGGDIGVAVTGIAGPGGGTETKPVGLTYIGLSTPWGDTVRRFVWKADREGNKRLSADAALQMVIEALVEKADPKGLGDPKDR